VSELNLSADAKHRLWRCYSLLLRLASEAEKNTATDSELCDGHESATVTEANELTRLDNDTPESELRQAGAEVGVQARDSIVDFKD
jgi:hypothetical protein